jgi:hypothetical protein
MNLTIWLPRKAPATPRVHGNELLLNTLSCVYASTAFKVAGHTARKQVALTL